MNSKSEARVLEGVENTHTGKKAELDDLFGRYRRDFIPCSYIVIAHTVKEE